MEARRNTGIDDDAAAWYLSAYLQANFPDEPIVQLPAGPARRRRIPRIFPAAAVAALALAAAFAFTAELTANRGSTTISRTAVGEYLIHFEPAVEPASNPVARGVFVNRSDMSHSLRAGVGKTIEVPLVRSGDAWTGGVTFSDSLAYAAFVVESNGALVPGLAEAIPDSASLATMVARASVLLRLDQDWPSLAGQADRLTAELLARHPYSIQAMTVRAATELQAARSPEERDSTSRRWRQAVQRLDPARLARHQVTSAAELAQIVGDTLMWRQLSEQAVAESERRGVFGPDVIGVRIQRMNGTPESAARLDTMAMFWGSAGSARYFVASRALHTALAIGDVDGADLWMRRAIAEFPAGGDQSIARALRWLDPARHAVLAYSWVEEIRPAADTIVPFLMTQREWDTVISNDVQQALEAIGSWVTPDDRQQRVER